MSESRVRHAGLAVLAILVAAAGCSCSRDDVSKEEAQRRADGVKRATTAGFAQLWPGLQGVAEPRGAPFGNFAQCTDQGGDVQYIATATFDPPAGSTPASVAGQLEHALSAAGWQVTPGVGRDTSDQVAVGGKKGDLVAAISSLREFATVRVLSPCVGVGTHDEVGSEGAKDLELP